MFHVYGGSASCDLAGKVAKILEEPLGMSETSKFANDELRVFIRETKVNRRAVIIQSLSAPVDSHIVEFCLMADALHRMWVSEIIAVIPWLGYSKQDKVFRSGEPLSVKVVAKILQTVPIKRLITFDLHNQAILGFFDIPVTNLTAIPLFADYFREKLTDKTVIVAPDAGSIKASTSFAGELDVPVVYMDKKRNLVSGKVYVTGISRPINGSDVIIVDDMIVTGATLVEVAGFLKKEKIRSLSVAATHHLYVPGAQEALEACGFDRIVVTDSIKPAGKSGKLMVLSVAGMIAAELKKSVD